MNRNEGAKTTIKTKGQVLITKGSREVDWKTYQECLLENINKEKGAYFCSNFEYPGRYSRWDIGFVNPAIEITTKKEVFEIRGLTNKGAVLLKIIHSSIKEHPHIEQLAFNTEKNLLQGKISKSREEDLESMLEENRSRKPSVFSVIRSLQELFYIEEGEGGQLSEFLGLYGAYGYDLVFQFEEIEKNTRREKGYQEKEDIHLFLPNEIFVVDHRQNKAFLLEYEFEKDSISTEAVSREKISDEIEIKKKPILAERVTEEIKYSKLVEKAIPSFLSGDFFEVVPSHILKKSCSEKPSDLFRELLSMNPSPYGFMINLGEEHLVGASPEMYIRVEGKRVESCPISGTAKRGTNAIEDYENMMGLLASEKEESELTMCTDVDRNDKSRICIPGSVRVIGRRQIEFYSHLMHTVDHVEGYLRDGFDGLDAFMSHMWAVTVTGAPKKAAMNWIEENEANERGWYGGAVGLIGFDGNINTGLTLRTMRLRNGLAEIRVGATVLYGSNPEGEERETRTKAAALMEVIDRVKNRKTEEKIEKGEKEEIVETKVPQQILVVDHEDSFVHTLGGYLRKEGAEVLTLRYRKALEVIKKRKPDLVVLSPGPGKPKDFNISAVISYCEENHIAVFGICLGMQGIIEHFGGTLRLLEEPKHGKSSEIKIIKEGKLLKGLKKSFRAGRYHSLYGYKIPDCLRVVGVSGEDQLPMAIEHKEKRIFGVQFHPESIMTLHEMAGEKIIQNLLEAIKNER